MERTGQITFKGNPMTLLGPDLQVGEEAPDFVVTSNALEPVKLSDYNGKAVIISTVPSLDTGVCEQQTKKFNEEAGKMDVPILTISMDLPFAQKRFCEANQTSAVKCLSDYKDRDFAEKFGLMIKELGLITRSVFVVDSKGKIAYKEIVPEVTDHPDYDKALAAAQNAG